MPALAVLAATLISAQSGSAIAERAGTLVFNTHDAAGYHLTVHDAKGTRALPIKPSEIPFDVSLGSDARHHRTAVYSRCEVGTHGWPKDAVVPGSCDIYKLDLTVNRERPLHEVDRPGVSEAAPSLDHGVLVFGREFALRAKPRPRTLSYRTRVVIRRLGASGRERTLMTLPGTDGGGYTSSRDVDLESSAINGSRVALGVYDPRENGGTAIDLLERGRSVQRLAHGGNGEENVRVHGTPAFAGRYLYWAYANMATDFHGPNGWVLRRDLRSGRTTAAPAPGYLEAVTADPLHPMSPLVVSSFASEDPETQQPMGTDAVQTLDAPVWGRVPETIHLR